MSRYTGQDVCDTLADDGTLYVDIIQMIVPTFTSDLQLVAVNADYVKRFDLLAKKFYGSSEDDWLLLWNNNFGCAYDLFNGVVLLFGTK